MMAMKDDFKFELFKYGLFALFFFEFVFYMVSSATANDPGKAYRILSDKGYKEIVLKGTGWCIVTDDDFINREFIAVAPSGATVQGTLCAGRSMLADSINTKKID